jgi:hypothetical protein
MKAMAASRHTPTSTGANRKLQSKQGRTKSNGRRLVRAAARGRPEKNALAYFRLAIAVRSNLPETTKVELHQLEPKPPGLIGVKLLLKTAV